MPLPLHLSTILSSSSSAISSHLSHLSKSFPNQPLLFTLSHNAAPNILSTLVNELTTFSPQTIGCLSAPLPKPYSNLTACSLAVFDARDVVMFRSTIPGRPQKQVGRWHPVVTRKSREGDCADWEREQSSEGLLGVRDWEDVWNGNVGVGVGVGAKGQLPEELERLDPNEVSSIVYMTDQSPEGLANSLSLFPNAPKLGLVASSTPFVTGRPFTLFRNQKIYESGAVGIALKRSVKSRGSMSGLKARAKVAFLGMEPISQPMTITECEGNMIISLDNQNPTKRLLSSIPNPTTSFSTTTKKEDASFALGVIENGQFKCLASRRATHQEFLRCPNSNPNSNSGEEGILAGNGATFKFEPYAPLRTALNVEPSPTGVKAKSFNLMSVVEDQFLLKQEDGSVHGNGVDEAYVLKDTFLAASGNGFLLARGGGTGGGGDGRNGSRSAASAETMWMCRVPGALATLEQI
ncbi:hypothetical protein AX17_003681 [Amanita inopinata Kibby_2008]|nr:hypothetical protein AX17_003681 [Amanita inopinata Kibby_2008]